MIPESQMNEFLSETESLTEKIIAFVSDVTPSLIFSNFDDKISKQKGKTNLKIAYLLQKQAQNLISTAFSRPNMSSEDKRVLISFLTSTKPQVDNLITQIEEKLKLSTYKSSSDEYEEEEGEVHQIQHQKSEKQTPKEKSHPKIEIENKIEPEKFLKSLGQHLDEEEKQIKEGKQKDETEKEPKEPKTSEKEEKEEQIHIPDINELKDQIDISQNPMISEISRATDLISRAFDALEHGTPLFGENEEESVEEESEDEEEEINELINKLNEAVSEGPKND